jgi:hypothetical protein
MSKQYPFTRLAVLAGSLALTVGCSEITDNNDPLDYPLVTPTTASAGEGESESETSDSIGDRPLELSESDVFIAIPPGLEAEDDQSICQVDKIKLMDLKMARPLDIEFISSSGLEYEIYLDIVDVELKTTVGTITQFETGVAEVDLTGKLLPDHEYVVDGELLNFTHDDLCVIGGRVHFTDLYLN